MTKKIEHLCECPRCPNQGERFPAGEDGWSTPCGCPEQLANERLERAEELLRGMLDAFGPNSQSPRAVEIRAFLEVER